jgi:molybdopterin/thiamine biosynthesis adenylyltransferase
MSDNLFTRIEQLFDIGLMADARVFIAGCGSGGGAVALQLAMSGIRNFTLADNDVLEPENVIRHVCGLRYVGQKKIDALADVLHDRNPHIAFNKLDIDILSDERVEAEVRGAGVVIIATDNEPTRYRLNELCVKDRIPFVVGKVFTRGIGGEVFAFRPGSSGCLACLEKILERTQYRDGVREIDLVSDEEREKLYGMEQSEIKDSPGLNVDIAFITAFHTRFALDAIADGMPARPQFLYPIQENYIVWGNRPVHPFKKNFELQRIVVRPQEGCLVCGE